MKTILFAALLGLLISSCGDDKASEKALLDEVIKTHDKLMADDGVIMKNKTALKSLTTADKDSVAAYNKLLDNADDAMMNWMNKFSPDFTGKSHEQVMTYLNGQKAEILKLDSQINKAITQSNTYITKAKGK